MANIEIVSDAANASIFNGIAKLKENTKYGVQKALFKIGKDLQDIFRSQIISKNKTGKLYIRRDRLGRGKRHQASAAGESPANRTGNYRKSVGFNVSGSSELRFGNSAEYAGFLEVGTSRMKARPGLCNAIKENERNTLRELSDGITKAI